MKKTFLTAGVIAIALGSWLLSGYLLSPEIEYSPSLADQNLEVSTVEFEAPPTRVRVRSLLASEQTRYAVVRGKTENKRTVDVRSETLGRVIERLFDRGSKVSQGDTLCKLAVENRPAEVEEAIQAVNKARIDYQGALKLKRQGFNSESTIAEKKASLASANALLQGRKIELNRTNITAPFAGYIEKVNLEAGDYARPGDSCATLVDLDPMLLVGQVSEATVLKLRLGETVTGILSDKTKVKGTLSFIGRQSNANTRTYEIEAELDNKGGLLRSGLTAEIQIPTEQVLAHKVSPAIFTLDDAGRIGIRAVNRNEIVEFHQINILSESSNGAWVTGLPNEVLIITVGHELVTAGERVDPVKDLPKNTTQLKNQTVTNS